MASQIPCEVNEDINYSNRIAVKLFGTPETWVQFPHTKEQNS